MVWNVINLAKNFQFLKQNGKGDDVIQMKAINNATESCNCLIFTFIWNFKKGIYSLIINKNIKGKICPCEITNKLIIVSSSPLSFHNILISAVTSSSSLTFEHIKIMSFMISSVKTIRT